MPDVVNQGVRIHYEVEGDGPPLVLQHGFHTSLQMWRESGYVEALKNDYRLILLDARGRGASAKPHDPKAYGMRLIVRDITAVMDHLNIGRAHYFGYSMGGLIGFGVAKYAPSRFHSLILGGASPYKPDPQRMDQQVEALRKGMEAEVAFMEQRLGRMTPERKARMLSNDPEALIAATMALRDEAWFEDVLPTMTMPCLVFAGDADVGYHGVEECVKHMPNVTFFSLPGCDHGQAMQLDLVLPHVTPFLARVSQLVRT